MTKVRATPSIKVAALGVLLLAATAVVVLWYAKPAILKNDVPVATHEDVPKWRSKLAKSPARIAFRHASDEDHARHGEPYQDIVNVGSLGPLDHEAEGQIRKQLERDRDGRQRALLGPCPSNPDEIQAALDEAIAFMEIRKREVCLRLLKERNYITLANGAQMPPLPAGATYLATGNWRLKEQWVYVLFVIAPGDDPEFDERTEYVAQLSDFILEARAGEFNNLDFGERVKRIDAHFAARERLAGSVSDADRASLEKQLLDARFSIDRQRYTLHHHRRP